MNIPISVDGQVVNFLVDTAGYVSTLNRSAAKALSLHAIPALHPLATVYGGETIAEYVFAPHVLLGSMKGNHFEFYLMPDRITPPEIGGTLAPDVLQQFDVEFDFANASLGLFTHDHCDGRVVYWMKDTSNFARLAFNISDDGHMVVPVTLDGKEMRAEIDTGSSQSLAKLERLEDAFAIGPTNPALKPISGVDKDHPIYRYPFKNLSLGGVTVVNPELLLIPTEVSKVSLGPEIVLGMNVIRRLHLFIAYREHALYVTPATAH